MVKLSAVVIKTELFQVKDNRGIIEHTDHEEATGILIEKSKKFDRKNYYCDIT